MIYIWKPCMVTRKVEVKVFLKNNLVILNNKCKFKNMTRVLAVPMRSYLTSLTKT